MSVMEVMKVELRGALSSPIICGRRAKPSLMGRDKAWVNHLDSSLIGSKAEALPDNYN